MSTVKMTLLAEVSNVRKGIDDVNNRLGKFGQTTSRIGGLLKGAFAGAAVGAAFKSVVSAASDAQQSVGATESVFGKFGKSVIASSKGAATEFGLSANTYRENANLLGSLFKNQGVAMDQLAGKSKQFIGIGADLSATFGGTTTQAVEALSSALKGEFDPLERYGISIKQSSINAVLAAKGQSKLTGAAQKQAQQMALTELVMKQSASSRGAFAKESDTLAHQQQVLAAKFENVKVAIGSVFLPILTRLVSFVSDSVLPKLTQFGAVFQSDILPRLKQVGSFISANVLPPLTVLGNFLANNKTVVATFAGVILTVVAAIRIWAGVQALLNVVLSANPIGLLVVAIAGLVAGLVYAYKHSEKFRNIVNAAFGAVKAVVSAVMPVISTVIRVGFKLASAYVTTYVRVIRAVITTAWKVIKAVTSATWAAIKNGIVNPIRSAYGVVRSVVSGVRSALTGAWNAARNATVAVWNGIRKAVSNAISNLMSNVRSIRSKVTGAFSGAGGWLVSAGRNIIYGLIGGISAMASSAANAAINVVRHAISAAKGALGIHSPSRVFADIGTQTIAGLIKGLGDSSGLRAVAGASAGLSNAVAAGFEAPSLSVAGGSGSTGGVVINVMVGPTSDPVAVGKEVAKSLSAYYNAGGRRL